MASKKYKKRRIGFVILLLLLLLIAVGVITVTGEINGGKKTGETVTVTIEQGSGTAAIARELRDAGLIRNPTLFKLYSRTHGGDGRYQYGDFTLEKGSSYEELIAALCSTVSYRETVTLTLPEGWNSFQMAKAAEAAGLCTEAEYLEAANALDYDFDWMKDISTDPDKLTVLEGFLYPETYSFFPDATARDIVTTQLREFQKKVLTEENRAALADSGFTLEQWVIFASIVQKESAGVEEMYNVSSVFHNRMKNTSEYPMLQSCTTNNFIWDYVEPYYHDQVPQAVLDAYDTYGRNGLPVGAIANAGTDAFDASLHPNDTPYYFFVTDVEYTHYYAVTYQQHLANIEKAKAVNARYGTVRDAADYFPVDARVASQAQD